MNERELIDLKERIAVAVIEDAGVSFTPAERDWLLDAVNEKSNADAVPELVSPDGDQPGRINPENTKAICTDLLRAVRRHYSRAPMSRERVLEILNALAMVVETVLHATNHDEKAVEFFEQARKLNQRNGRVRQWEPH